MLNTTISTQQLFQIIGHKQVQIEFMLSEIEQLKAGLESLKQQFDELKKLEENETDDV